MPVKEAMAAGLPVIIPPPKEGFSEGLEDAVVFSKRDPDSFAENINMILNDINLQKTLKEKSQRKAIDFDFRKIEKREAGIYRELLDDLQQSRQ
jgi:glycosyltransferase involved in cell wall biosynthesis